MAEARRRISEQALGHRTLKAERLLTSDDAKRPYSLEKYSGFRWSKRSLRGDPPGPTRQVIGFKSLAAPRGAVRDFPNSR